MSLVIAQIIRRRSKRFCATPDDYCRLYIMRIRKTHTVLVNVLMPLMELKTIPILKAFLLDNYENYEMKVKSRILYGRVTYMQRKVRDQQVKQSAKVDILVNYWDKMYGTIMSRAVELGDKKCKKLCTELILVSPCI